MRVSCVIIAAGLVIMACGVDSVGSAHILDAPLPGSGFNVPTVIAGKPKPLLEGKGPHEIYDLASQVTDEDYDILKTIFKMNTMDANGV
ncbi:hypothetical protein pipiens_008744 [Culex pipiens pipiens]|uniref:Uncharacterized protein n=1 Tax=Culex pipiens pipiens TaxID=38569 RepID=A0ABD1DG91_CULPP